MLRTSDLEYELPAGRIATRAAEPRDSARLMVVARAEPERVEDRVVRDLPEILRPGDLLVVNTTAVLAARFRGRRVGSGGKIEGLYLSDAAVPSGSRRWVAFIKGRHTRVGAEIELFDRSGQPSTVRLTVVDRSGDEPGAWIVEIAGEAETGEILKRVGLPPLPPYILAARRHAGLAEDDAADRERYQTVYARMGESRSVAAPTAGLHFTPQLLGRLTERGVERADVVLHVGSGTFKPVETEFVEQHPIHSEWCSMSEGTVAAIRRVRSGGGRVIAVGTTAARTIESYAKVMEGGGDAPDRLVTRLLVTPGYEFRWVDGMLTNFHLPRSTLMAMVAALLPGEGVAELKRVYGRAIGAGYRFYSYGDAMLIV